MVWNNANAILLSIKNGLKEFAFKEDIEKLMPMGKRKFGIKY